MAYRKLFLSATVFLFNFYLPNVDAQEAKNESQVNTFMNPPILTESSMMPSGTLYLRKTDNPAQPHAGREQTLDLKVKYIEGLIRNPAQGHPDKVRLRSYSGTGVDPYHPFIAPTIEAMPGDTVRIRLDNQLPPEPDCSKKNDNINVPHCYNYTNLHGHGLWVSPTGNSDNVLLSINPGVKFEYEYNIPSDHPSGTFWYHPHKHGSTAVQVGSGMAGALVIRGDRMPTETSNGDIDTLLKTTDGKPFPEHLLVFEQIPYACLKDGELKKKPDGSIDWSCSPGEVGEVASYKQFEPGSWDDSGRFTTVNGRVRPVFANTKAGQVERWRLVHAGVRETIKVEFRKLNTNDFLSREKDLSAADEDRFVRDLCTGSPIPYAVVAADGLTMPQGLVQTNTTLQPGYRNDLLVNFPEDGLYCIVNPPVKAADNASREDKARSVLGFVRVKGGNPTSDPIASTTQQLIERAQKAYQPELAKEIVSSLKEGLKLTKFVPHPPITDEEVSHVPAQELVFYIDTTKTPPTFEVGNSFSVVKNSDGTYSPAGSHSYSPTQIERPLVLGTAQEWQLQSYFASHPFHIHVNPFEIIQILDPNGNDVSMQGAKEADGSISQYAGLKGVWKDTLWIKSNITKPLSSINAPTGTYKISIRTRYERYIGEFVLHCHILDHEDQGMMQNVVIGLPDGAGGLAQGHH
ncbi:multicopper oxidase family protein [Pectobacterium versatile]|uniref:multicopper oxidase family protein n=1 Tax=Pectobacterium versatile TaxID=2488639 RepID=UPI001CC9AC93|nr:multicopper oxidase family protein [Pectobacterium versatile]